jgi:hypothetical protein
MRIFCICSLAHIYILLESFHVLYSLLGVITVGLRMRVLQAAVIRVSVSVCVCVRVPVCMCVYLCVCVFECYASLIDGLAAYHTLLYDDTDTHSYTQVMGERRSAGGA